jgi:hypothetical protein
MRTALHTAVIGILLTGLAACGGSGNGAANRTGDVATGPETCADGSCSNNPGGGDQATPPPPEPTPQPQCTTDADCPPVNLACTACADGSAACATTVCENGQCTVTMPACPQPRTCGDAAGSDCPPGYVCARDPNCDPTTGVACSPTCVPETRPGFCGGIAGVPCPNGYECVDDPNDNCDPKNGGADCGGVCQPITSPSCTSDMDCPQLGAPCAVCPDGSAVCPSSTCVNGQCTVTRPTCTEPKKCGEAGGSVCPPGYVCADDPNCDPTTGVRCGQTCVPEPPPGFCGGIAGLPCPDGYECVDDPSDNCDPKNGGADCSGICQPVTRPSCASDADCPQLRVACGVCPDGTAACPSSVCVNGQCTVTMPTCPEPKMCGDAASAVCPPGYVCANDPNCDPTTGVRCAQTCVPAQPPGFCGGIAGLPCPDGYECVDDPSDECDPKNGGADCGGICQPITRPICTSDMECPQPPVPCALCADGSATCPTSTCVNGQCTVTMSTCPGPKTCGDAAGIVCPPGYICADDPTCDATTGIQCGQTCVPQQKPGFCGGIAGVPCPDGYECVDDPSDNCILNQGADCGGICQPVATGGCQTDMDCPVLGLRCSACPDGSAACPSSTCVNGQCTAVMPVCPPSTPCGGFAGLQCNDGYECVDDPSDDCDPNNGGADCPGICQPATPRPCMSDSECPAIGAPCKQCPDGTAACPRSVCTNGQCGAVFETCAPPA